MAVGPSAAPIIAMDAASRRGKKKDARIRVKKIPPWAAAPMKMSQGFSRRGPKSIMAPIPIKRRSGKTSKPAIPKL